MISHFADIDLPRLAPIYLSQPIFHSIRHPLSAMSFAPSHPSAFNSANTLWVGDLPLDIDESFLQALFSTCGPDLLSVKLIRSKDTFLPAGYGFVEFRSRELAEHVLKTFDGQPYPFPSTPRCTCSAALFLALMAHVLISLFASQTTRASSTASTGARMVAASVSRGSDLYLSCMLSIPSHLIDLNVRMQI